MLNYLTKNYDTMASNNQNPNILQNQSNRPSFRNLMNVQKQKVASRQKSRRSSRIIKQNSQYSSAIKTAQKNSQKKTIKPTQGPNFHKKSIFHHIDVRSAQKEQHQQINEPTLRTIKIADANTDLKTMPNMNMKAMDANKDDSGEIQISIQMSDCKFQINQDKVFRASNDNNREMLTQKTRKSIIGSNSYTNLQQQKQNEQTGNTYTNKLIKLSKRLRRVQQKLKTQQKQVLQKKISTPNRSIASNQSLQCQNIQKIQKLQNFLAQYEHQLTKQTTEIEEGYVHEFVRLEENYDSQITDLMQVRIEGQFKNIGTGATGEAVWKVIERVQKMLGSK